MFKSRWMRWQGMWHALKVLVGIAQGKITLGRCGHRWEDNIKINIQEMELV
jgi:hypothetical protein